MNSTEIALFSGMLKGYRSPQESKLSLKFSTSRQKSSDSSIKLLINVLFYVNYSMRSIINMLRETLQDDLTCVASF